MTERLYFDPEREDGDARRWYLEVVELPSGAVSIGASPLRPDETWTGFLARIAACIERELALADHNESLGLTAYTEVR